MILALSQFKGMAPSIDASVLGDAMAQTAINCRLNMGSIKPLLDTGAGVNPSKTGTVLSLYQYQSKWFNWLTDVNICKSPIAGDSYERVYWTGDIEPRMSVQGTATSTSDYPSAWFKLGIPVPADAASGTVEGEITDDDPTLVKSRAYVYTYVSAYGEEGPPSPVSGVFAVAPGQRVDLTGLSVAPAGNYNISTKRIYRTNTGSSSTEFQFVGEVGVAVAVYSDTVEDAMLGEVLPSTDWSAPDADMVGIITLPFGSMAGFFGNIVCFSVPYMPHAWPASYQYPLDEDVVAIGSYGNSVLVTTTGAPYLITGSDPVSMSVERLEQGYACISKRGFVDMGYACIYPAINGLMMAGMGNIKLLTEGILTQADWLALNPTSIHGYLCDGKYIGFWSNAVSAGFIYDPQTGDLSYHDIAATAGYHNQATGDLHLVVSGQIKKWEGSTSKKTATWKSKKFLMPGPLNLSCAQVKAAAYPVTMKLYADGVLKATQTVLSGSPFRLPAGYRAEYFEVELSGSNVINGVFLADSMAEMAKL